MGGNPVQDGGVVAGGIERYGRRFETAPLLSAAPDRSGTVLYCNYNAMGQLINFYLGMYYRLETWQVSL